MRRVFLFLAFLVLAPALVQAQVVLAPTTVEFTASADHNTLGLDGITPVLTYYEMRHYLEGASLPVQVVPLGKPAPNGENKIIATNAAWFLALEIVPNVRHVARVAAIGPGGEGLSEVSNPFGRLGPPTATTAPLVRQ